MKTPQCGVEADQIEGMEKQVSKLLPVISDAEANQFKSELVKKWLAELKDVVYDAEDVFDLIQTESLRFKLKQSNSPSHIDYASPLQCGVEADQIEGMEKQVSKLLPVISDAEANQLKSDPVREWLEELKDVVYDTDCASPLQVLSGPSTSSVTSLNDKIKKINKRLEAIVRRKKDLGLKKGIPGTWAGESFEPRLETSPLNNEPCIYGRDRDVDKLIELLLSAEPCNENVGVIPIVGQGGIGKTTFAQRLYNHMAVEKHFQLRAWVCVSDVKFDVIRVTKGIIESTTHKSCDLTDLSAIHVALTKALAGKKFLIILDDVWTEEYKDWNALSTPFRAGAKGSKVIITTRSEKVFSFAGTVPSHHLELLSEEDCFKLLKRHAFSIQNSDAQPALEGIGKKIAGKCRGLPLAAKALGGVLRSKRGEVEWKEILDSDIWALETELNPALWLSYHYLPAHLKRCFAYCGIIPKDREFSKDNLIGLWMAQGFMEQKGENHKKRMEDVGEGYFCELLSRSFFQQSDYNKSMFVMHDLVNDLARAASGETCLTMDEEKQWEKLISKKIRHVSYSRYPCRETKILTFEAIYRANKLRTFASFDGWNINYGFKVAPELLSRLVGLRALCLNSMDTDELLESIGNLVHLQYLDLSGTKIRRLPESINALCNLQTLLLRDCRELEELHMINMGNLINLRCLDLSLCYRLKKMPRGIGGLKELQMLPYFIVDENNGIGIEELTNLEHLRGTLQISGLQTIRDPIHKKINLRNKPHLRTLELEWDDGDIEIDLESKSVAELVLDRLQPNANLESVTVHGYYGTCSPRWLVDPSCYLNLAEREEQTSLPIYNKVVKGGLQYQHHLTHQQLFPMLKYIEIVNCWNLESLPEELFLLPSLEQLEIEGCYSLNSFTRGDSRCSSSTTAIKITNLREIGFNDCENLESLPEILHKLTSLESLEIWGCNKLRSFPEGGLRSTKLKCLTIEDCEDLMSLPNQMILLTSLEELRIADCPNLLSIPEGGLPSINLRDLQIDGCRGLKYLGNQQHSLTSLQSLRITNCPALISFPEGIFPSNLESLTVSIDCNTYRPLSEWKSHFHRFTSLRNLYIYGCEGIESLSDLSLPSTLTDLAIMKFPHLKALSNGLQHLTSLESLKIQKCPKVASLPDQGLPTKLRELCIRDCPLLKQWCESIKEED